MEKSPDHGLLVAPKRSRVRLKHRSSRLRKVHLAEFDDIAIALKIGARFRRSRRRRPCRFIQEIPKCLSSLPAILALFLMFLARFKDILSVEMVSDRV